MISIITKPWDERSLRWKMKDMMGAWLNNWYRRIQRVTKILRLSIQFSYRLKNNGWMQMYGLCKIRASFKAFWMSSKQMGPFSSKKLIYTKSKTDVKSLTVFVFWMSILSPCMSCRTWGFNSPFTVNTGELGRGENAAELRLPAVTHGCALIWLMVNLWAGFLTNILRMRSSNSM